MGMSLNLSLSLSLNLGLGLDLSMSLDVSLGLGLSLSLSLRLGLNDLHTLLLLLLSQGELRGSLLLKELANRCLVSLRLEHAKSLRCRCSRHLDLRMRIMSRQGRTFRLCIGSRRRSRLALELLTSLGPLAHGIQQVLSVLLLRVFGRWPLRALLICQPLAPFIAVPRRAFLCRQHEACGIKDICHESPMVAILLRKCLDKCIVVR